MTKYQSWIDKAKTVDLAAVLAARGIKLTGRRGRELKADCPHCGYSLSINTRKGAFRCGRCDQGGYGAISLVQFLDGHDDFEKAAETVNGSPPPKKEKKEGNGARKPYSPVMARYVYRTATKDPYLRVCKREDKTFFEEHWNGEMWVSGAPEGPTLPYRLPQLKKALSTTPVHICEGEKDAEALAALHFTATTNPNGAANWKDVDLNEHFRGRHVYLHEDNDDDGRKRVLKIARALQPIAASVRIVRLPGLPPKGDVSDFLAADTAAVKFKQHCEATPIWEPTHEDLVVELAKLSLLEYQKRRDVAAAEIGIGVTALDKIVAEARGDKVGSGAGDDQAKKKQADILIKLAEGAELFHTPDDVGYATIIVDDHHENWPLRSKGFKRWLARAFYAETNTAPNSEAMQAALGVLEAHAQFDTPEHEIYVRVAGHDGRIYIDLSDRDWRAIEVDGDSWRVIDSPPVRFRRSAGMKSLPEPEAGGSLEKHLRPLLNVKTDTEFVLAVAWLLAAFRERGPYPVLTLAGEQGSAKSTIAALLRALVDPNSVPLRTLPKNEHDIYISARNAHVLAYDNTSGLSDWMSDCFCRLATGGGFSTRELYSDQEEVLFGSKRPIILNGIDDVVTRPDLADRAIVLTLAAIGDEARKLETELWEDFEEKRPAILGALLDAVCHGIRSLPDVKLDRLPRMADFATWVTACEGALWKKGTFMTAYAANIVEGVEAVLEADLVAAVLRKYMEIVPEFVGTASDLLKALNSILTEAEQKAKGWPKRPPTLAKALRRFATPLRKVGIEITFEREGRSRVRKVIITRRLDNSRDEPSVPSAPSAGFDFNDLGRTAEEGGTVRQGVGTVRQGVGTVRPAHADSADAQADSDPTDTVRCKPLKNHEEDSADSGDSKSRILSRHKITGPKPEEDRTCAQCRGPVDGMERLCSAGDGEVWLHPTCERFYVAAT
jgi:hypothetical protein